MAANKDNETVTFSPQELLAQEFFDRISDPGTRSSIVDAILEATKGGNAAAQKTLLSLFGKLEDFGRNAKNHTLVKITSYTGKVPSYVCPFCGRNITDKTNNLAHSTTSKEAKEAPVASP